MAPAGGETEIFFTGEAKYLREGGEGTVRLRRLSLLARSIAFAAQAVSNLPVAAAAPPTLPSLRGGGEYRAPTPPSIREGERALPSAPRIGPARKIARCAPTPHPPPRSDMRYACRTPPYPPTA